MRATDLGVLGQLYTDGAAMKVRHHRVRHEGFRSFCVSLGHLQRALRDSNSGTDPYWTALVRSAKRFRFDAMASPRAFSDIGLLGSVPSLRTQYARCEGMYPQLVALVRQVIDLLEILSSTKDSPLLDAASAVTGNDLSDSFAIVLCETRLMAAMPSILLRFPALKGARVVTQMHLCGT